MSDDTPHAPITRALAELRGWANCIDRPGGHDALNRIADQIEEQSTSPAGTADAPDAGGDLRTAFASNDCIWERGAPPDGRWRRAYFTESGKLADVALSIVGDRLPAPDPALARDEAVEVRSIAAAKRLPVGTILETGAGHRGVIVAAPREPFVVWASGPERDWTAFVRCAVLSPEDPEGAEETVTAWDAVDVWDGAVAPGGYVCGECGHPVETEPCADHQPDAYARMSAPDDPEGAEAVELAPGSATAREAGPAAGGA